MPPPMSNRVEVLHFHKISDRILTFLVSHDISSEKLKSEVGQSKLAKLSKEQFD